MERLLVATDFSARSDRALRRAMLLAKKLGAELTLVHVVDADQPDRLVAADRTEASGLLAEIVGALHDDDGLDVEWTVKVDDLEAGILLATDELSAALLVLGPNRRRLRDIFVGTTVERVVQRSTVPVLIAAGTPSGDYVRALLALDFDAASKQAGRTALAMGVFEHTDVVVMHAFDAPAEGMMRRAMMDSDEIGDYVESEGNLAAAKLEKLREEVGLPRTPHAVIATVGTPARTILESAQERQCDLIVLGANQRQGLERLLVGSVAADVIRDAHRDVLIIPVPEQQ